MRALRSARFSAFTAGCIVSLCSVAACRAIVGNYEVGPAHDSGTDAKSDSGAGDGATDTAPIGDAPTDVPGDAAVDTGDAGLLASCNAYFLAGNKADGVYSISAKEGSVKVFCDMTRDGGGWTLVALRSPSTSSAAWRSEAAVTKTKELTEPATPADMVLDIDWTQLGFTQVIYELGPPPTPTRALFATLNETNKNGARGALSLLPPPTEKPKCLVDGVEYMACSPPPTGDGGAPPGDPGKGLGWLFSPTGVSCWWAWDTSLGAQECKTAKAGGGHIWVK